MPTDRETLDALTDRIYDAAAGFCGWDAVLSDLARLLGGTAAVLGVVGPRCPGRIVHVGVDPACMARYLERHAGRNELAARSASLPVGAVVTDGSLMRQDEFLRTAFYNECMRPQGLRSLINLRAARGERGSVANVCVLRTAAEGEFGADVDTLLDELHATPPADPALPVLVAGEPEDRMRERRLAEGVPVPDTLDTLIRGICERCGAPYLLRPNL